MAAVYFLGAKSITSKKSGKEFFPANFLTKNAWGDWTVATKFCASEEVYEDITDNILVGSPVICSLDMNSNIIRCVAHDSVPALEFPEDDL